MADYFLSKMAQYNPITIQCHDNPDADAIGAGYALYCYFKYLGKSVRLIYSGRDKVSKSNLVKMIDEMHIPLEYVSLDDARDKKIEGILITVDCQYGAGNVTKIDSDEKAIIDHHQVEIEDIPLSCIISNVGSCSTIVWKMLNDCNFDFSLFDNLSTALYYGLYTDTNQLSEIYNPLDKDASEQLDTNRVLVNMLRNSNISMDELEVAGVALLRNSYNSEYGFSLIRTQPCDPNILGLISDFLLQVDSVKVCVVYNETDDGFKFSVRSCINEVNASELAGFLSEKVGNGGGHFEKAGGFINRKLYHDIYPGIHSEAYFNTRLVDYFGSYDVIYADKYQVDMCDMKKYSKNKLPIGFVRMTDIWPEGTPITVRTLECDMDLIIEKDLIMMIGIKGEVYPTREDKFNNKNRDLGTKYIYDECVIENTYVPMVKNRIDGKVFPIADYASTCVPTGNVCVYAKELDRTVKVFTQWDKQKYMLGKPGDYIAVREDDLSDVYIIERKIFFKSYSPVF